MRLRVSHRDFDSTPAKPLNLSIFLHVATRDDESTFLKKKGDASHADAAHTDQVDVSTFFDPLMCMIDLIHGYAPPTLSSRSANRPAALICARFFMAETIRSNRSGFSETLIR